MKKLQPGDIVEILTNTKKATRGRYVVVGAIMGGGGSTYQGIYQDGWQLFLKKLDKLNGLSTKTYKLYQDGFGGSFCSEYTLHKDDYKVIGVLPWVADGNLALRIGQAVLRLESDQKMMSFLWYKNDCEPHKHERLSAWEARSLKEAILAASKEND